MHHETPTLDFPIVNPQAKPDEPIFKRETLSLNYEDKKPDRTPIFPNRYWGQDLLLTDLPDDEELVERIRPSKGTLGVYLADVKRTPRLSQDREIELGAQGMKKSEEAVWELVLHNRLLAVKKAGNYLYVNRHIGANLHEVLALLTDSLITSARKYDSTVKGKDNRRKKFGNYAAHLMDLNLKSLTRALEKRSNLEESFDELLPGSDMFTLHDIEPDNSNDHPSEPMDRAGAITEVKKVLDGMPIKWQKRYLKVVRLFYGFDGYDRIRTLNEVGNLMGTTGENVRQQLTRAIPPLKKAILESRVQPYLF